jgi:hypothetical protein
MARARTPRGYGVGGRDVACRLAQVGTIYTTGSKIAEHGGDNPGDRDVPLVVYAPSNISPAQSDRWVENTQVGPTILKLLGLDPNRLQAAREEGTKVPPGIETRVGDRYR